MNKRIKGTQIDIEYKDTLDFFENHGKEGVRHRYNYVLFQDNNPEIAINRDAFEKTKIREQIEFTSGSRVLDIGCGIGRWGETLLSLGLNYTGVDYSKKLLEVAEENLRNFGESYQLIQSSFQELSTTLDAHYITNKFEYIFINGVLMYINDKDLRNCLKQLIPLMAEKCTIYIKESIAVEDRLTLNQFFSEDLKANYTAIYRNKDIYDVMIDDELIKKGNLKLRIQGDVFDTELKNRIETKDYYWILSTKE